MKIVRLQEWGAVLGTRLLGEQIRQRVETLLDQGEVVGLDFGDVEVATPSFVDELVGKLFLQRGQTALRGRLRIVHAAPEIHALIRRMVSERLKELEATATPPGTALSEPAKRPPPPELDPFKVLSAVQQDYLIYVRTFQRFQNPQIRDWVMERVERGTLLWKPPFVQLSRPFAPGETLERLIEGNLLHSGVLQVLRRDPDDPASPPIHPYQHQTKAIRAILSGRNVVVSTGTGSGKSFAFGIPIVSYALRVRHEGIKAVIVYPMNALANSQYDDFARRLHGSGLTIARYTGDTATSPAEALERYREATGREGPYDSEVLSREEIQARPPDILRSPSRLKSTQGRCRARIVAHWRSASGIPTTRSTCWSARPRWSWASTSATSTP